MMPDEPSPSLTPSAVPARLRTIVVDDDPISRLVLRHLTESLGHEAVEAVGAAEALALVRLGGFHAVLADLEMPGLSGYDLLAGIQAEGDRAPLVVAVSGHVGDAHVSRVNEAGFFAHIAKPVNVTVLGDILERIVEELALGPDGRAAPADDAVERVVGDIASVFARDRRFVSLVVGLHAARGRQLIERSEQALKAGDARRAAASLDSLSRAAAAIGMGEVESQARQIAARVRASEPAPHRLARLSAEFEAGIERGASTVESLTGTRPSTDPRPPA